MMRVLRLDLVSCVAVVCGDAGDAFSVPLALADGDHALIGAFVAENVDTDVAQHDETRTARIAELRAQMDATGRRYYADQQGRALDQLAIQADLDVLLAQEQQAAAVAALKKGA